MIQYRNMCDIEDVIGAQLLNQFQDLGASEYM